MKEIGLSFVAKSINLFVIHTPFHLVQFERMINDDAIDQKLPSIVFYSDFVTRDSIQALFNYNSCEIILLPKNNFLLNQLFKNIFIESAKLNRLIRHYTEIIKSVFTGSSFSNIILYSGTDKHIFDQTLFFYIDKFCRSVEIVIVDEGIGLYVKKNVYSSGLNFLASKITKVVFGVPLLSISKLGSNPKSQIIYARYPELVYKEKGKQYFKIEFEHTIKPKYGDYLLLIGSPIYDERILGKKEYYSFLKTLFDTVARTETINSFSQILKPHPREDIDIYKNFNIDMTLPKVSFELIGEVPVGIIICFDSSSLLEIIGAGVDPRRVVNIKFGKKSIVSDLFNLDDIYYNGNLSNFHKSLERRFAQFLNIYA